MKLNSKIIDILKECNIHVDDGVAYLMCLHYSVNCTFFPQEFKVKMNMTGIYTSKEGSIHWNVPLIEEQVTAFDWVKTEYCPMFEKLGKPASVKESISRMKKLFASNPEVRKDDVMEAARMYIRNTEQKYVMFPHYFISKGVGVNKTETIFEWLHKVNLVKQQKEERKSSSNILQ